MTRRSRIGALVLLLLSVLPRAVAGSPASAQQSTTAAPPPVRFDPTIRIHTDLDGVTTRIDLLWVLPGDRRPGTAADADTAARSAEAPYCRVSRLFGSIYGGPLRRPGANYAQVRCGSDPYGFITMLDVGDDGQAVVPETTVDPEALARALRDRLPAPPVTIRAAPAIALAGQETWFWLAETDDTAYRSAPIRQTSSLAGVTVEVEATPTSYRWDFGDATGQLQTTSSTGQPYPARSPIRHTYQRASTGYQVVCAFAFQVRWRQPGTEWAALPPITRTITLTVPVAQSQGALTR